ESTARVKIIIHWALLVIPDLTLEVECPSASFRRECQGARRETTGEISFSVRTKKVQNVNLAPNCNCLGVPTIDEIAPTPVALVMVVPLADPLLPGAASFWMLKKLNPSKRSCNCLLSLKGMFLNRETSRFVTCALRKPFRPKFPKLLEGVPKAQGLNQVAAV